MKLKKELSIISIIIGIFIIIIQPFSSVLTGAVIEISSTTSRIWFFIGLGLIIIGGIFLGWFDNQNNYGAKTPKARFKGRNALRRHNEEAQYAAREAYVQEYGRKPSKKELRVFMRKPHERGELSDLVKQQKAKRRKS
tara:strand:+ start:1693 stop:2106 length:414 start_codon:yes stop_codon:yes gene_type:complete